jgi:hypothetical protein
LYFVFDFYKDRVNEGRVYICMSTELLLLAVLAALTVVALMIAINSRGKWRATLSSLLAVCMFGGTTWVFALHYSKTANADAQGERHSLELEKLRGESSPPGANAGEAAVSSLVAEASGLANLLLTDKMYEPGYTREQLMARAGGAEQRLEALQQEVRNSKLALDRYPTVTMHLESALAELKAACHVYRNYYYAENTDEEVSTERLLRLKAKTAKDSLAKAEKLIISIKD